MFSAEVGTKHKRIEADSYVVEGGTCCLLGRNTATALGILTRVEDPEIAHFMVKIEVNQRKIMQISKKCIQNCCSMLTLILFLVSATFLA